jgi:hypothetical protein
MCTRCHEDSRRIFFTRARGCALACMRRAPSHHLPITILDDLVRSKMSFPNRIPEVSGIDSVRMFFSQSVTISGINVRKLCLVK